MRRLWLVALFLLPFHLALADSGLWQREAVQQRAQSGSADDFYRADQGTLVRILSQAGDESRPSQAATIEIPTIGGAIERFRVLETTVMEPGLAAKYPQFKAYRIRGVDDPAASGRVTITGKGLNAMVVSPSGTLYLDPQGSNRYRAYSKRSQASSTPFKCGVEGHDHSHPAGIQYRGFQARTPGSFQVYRLALAAASEYVSAVDDGNPANGDAKTDAIAELFTTVNRINEIYERDLGIRLVLVANNSSVVFDVAADADPYTNPDVATMLDENQATIDSVIGSGNYDIGHVFGTGGGGIASVGSVCATGFKAQGATGLSGTPGDAFYIDYVAHEMGHQFGASHSFNGTTNACGGGNRSQATAYEPGSGSTIMAYAGICGGENIQSSSDAHFHAGSIGQIDQYTTTGDGSSCGTLVSASNPSEPVVNAGIDYTVPAKTPFVLNASASDADGDSLTYNWYQMDSGTATTSAILGYDLADNALFRSYLPRAESFRHFPAMGTTLANQYDNSEVLGCVDRQINFRVVVRDGNIVFTRGGVAYDDMSITVDGDAGPFAVTSFNSAQNLAPGNYTVTWEVANTNTAPVSCAQVDISLLSFNASKSTYSELVLAPGVTNDGAASITIPTTVANTHSRFKIQCSDNVFYDISDADLTIGGSVSADNNDHTVHYNAVGLVSSTTPLQTCGIDVISAPDTTDPVIAPPADIVVSAQTASGTSASQSQIAAFLAGATAVDNVDGVITSISNNAPTLFPAGENTIVTFSATDAAGNTGTATATVTVRDYNPVFGSGGDGGGLGLAFLAALLPLGYLRRRLNG